MDKKLCRDCAAHLPLSEFYRRKDGKPDCYCRDCRNRRNRQYKAINLAKIRERDRKYASSPKGLKRTAEYEKRRGPRSPIKLRAMRAARHAIASGALQRTPCEACGTTERVVAHHDDYGKPLEVRFLCRIHHAAWHRRNGPGLNAQEQRSTAQEKGSQAA